GTGAVAVHAPHVEVLGGGPGLLIVARDDPYLRVPPPRGPRASVLRDQLTLDVVPRRLVEVLVVGLHSRRRARDVVNVDGSYDVLMEPIQGRISRECVPLREAPLGIGVLSRQAPFGALGRGVLNANGRAMLSPDSADPEPVDLRLAIGRTIDPVRKWRLGVEGDLRLGYLVSSGLGAVAGPGDASQPHWYAFTVSRAGVQVHVAKLP